VLLRERDDPHRVLPIFIGTAEATAIALALSGEAPPRPMTHDLMAALLKTLGAHVDSVEVTELSDGTFFAELVLTGSKGSHRVDSRPSDAIALAVRVGAPVLVNESVLDAAGVTVRTTADEVPLDESEIEEAVGQFRRLLDELDPGDLASALGDERPPAPPPDPSGGAGEAGDDPDRP
jgi:hypothetical protein